MACDCDQLMNELRALRQRVAQLESCTGCGRNGRRSGTGGNGQGGDDLIERVFRDERWIAATDCLKFIIKGKV